MHVLFETFLAPGASSEGLLSDETVKDTQAQMMTIEDAEKVGFQNVPEDAAGRERLLIVVGKIDERRIQNVLEADPRVAAFRVQLVDL